MWDTVAIVGAGSWGLTLAKIAADSGRKVLLWARRAEVAEEINGARRCERYLPGVTLPDAIRATTELGELCEAAGFIVMVVPSHGFRAVARQLGDHVHGEHVVVHATKGIEQGTFKRMTQVLREETCARKIGVLTGPNLAGELARQQPAGTLVASRYDEVFHRAHDALHTGYFRVYGGKDVVGAEVAGAFKNIVAVAAGVADGLGMGDNTKALLLTRGINEMARLGMAMGAEAITFGGMAGIGDLIATCASPLSRNHQVGERLARGQSLDEIRAEMHMVAEGVKTTAAVHAYCRERGLALPIVAGVHRLLYEGAPVSEVLADLMAEPTGDEFRGFRL